MRKNGFFACPGYKIGKWRRDCGGMESLYCAKWDCVVANDGNWKWAVKSDLITMQFVFPRTQYRPNINLVEISFTGTGQTERQWVNGLTWGITLYQRPWHGGLIQILLRVEAITRFTQIGPNTVLKPNPKTRKVVLTPTPKSVDSSKTESPTTWTPVKTVNSPEEIASPMWKMLQALVTTVNATSPNLTQSCWLCYPAAPPFYEAVGINVTYNVSASHPSSWETRPWGLTMTHVNSKGACAGQVPREKHHLCATQITETWGPNKWVTPESGWWLCSKTGLTPALSTTVFDKSNEFCIIVAVLPRVLYHSQETLLSYWERESEWTPHRARREPITALTIGALFSLGLAGAGTGVAALVTRDQGLTSLRLAIDEDLERLRQSISDLEQSLTSLSEVVLQNRRGLDLLFLKEGGLCAALREECCFYVDKTGAVRESMTKLKEDLAKRKRDYETQKGWFESWFNQKPWLVTLLSAIAGPFAVLLLLLTIGPRIINRVISFVKERINTVQLLVLRQHYQVLHPPEDDSSV